jgi:hypothetical protein
MDLDQLAAWRKAVQDAVDSVVAGFEDSYGESLAVTKPM